MACTFSIDFTATPASVITTIKTKVEANNGTFTGDENSGNFSVPVPTSRIDGGYTITGQQMTIDITHKPFFLSCNQIKDYVSGNLFV